MTPTEKMIALEIEVSQLRSERLELSRMLGDSAFYIRRMAGMLENHPSRVQLRALAFAQQKLRKFERTITTQETHSEQQ